MSTHPHAACPNCGHAHRHGRLTLRGLAHTVGEHLSLERGLVLTVADLVRRPSRVIRGFFEGERGVYVSPITAFFFAAALSLLVFHQFEAGMLAYSRTDVTRQLGAAPPEARARFFALIDAVMRIANKPAIVGLLACLPEALALRLLFRSSRFNIAEMLAYALYTRSLFIVIYSALFVPAMGFTDGWRYAVATSMLVTFAVAVVTAMRVFGARPSVGLRATVAAGVGWLASVAFSIVGAVVLVALERH